MHHGTCVTHVPWCMSGTLTRGGGKHVPGIPGACATDNFAYLARGPCSSSHRKEDIVMRYLLKAGFGDKNTSLIVSRLPLSGQTWWSHFVLYTKIELTILFLLLHVQSLSLSNTTLYTIFSPYLHWKNEPEISQNVNTTNTHPILPKRQMYTRKNIRRLSRDLLKPTVIAGVKATW